VCSSKCEIVIDYRVYTAYVHMDIFTTDYQHHTAQMVVRETLWQLHTLIVINSLLLVKQEISQTLQIKGAGHCMTSSCGHLKQWILKSKAQGECMIDWGMEEKQAAIWRQHFMMSTASVCSQQ